MKICEKILVAYKSVPEAQQEFKKLTTAFAPQLLRVVSASLKASKSPYNESFITTLAHSIEQLKDLIRNMIKITSKNNPTSYKDEFMESLKVKRKKKSFELKF